MVTGAIAPAQNDANRKRQIRICMSCVKQQVGYQQQPERVVVASLCSRLGMVVNVAKC